MTTVARSPSQSRRRDAAATIDDLKAAATQLLVTDGLGNLSIAPILVRAGVSRGALFHHFPSKSHLIAAAFTDLLQGAAQELHKLGRRLRRKEISTAEFVAGVRTVFCSDMFIGLIEIAIAIRADDEMTERVRSSVDDWWLSLAEFWRETFDLPGLSDAQATQHWIMATNLLRGHAFTSSYRGRQAMRHHFAKALRQ